MHTVQRTLYAVNRSVVVVATVWQATAIARMQSFQGKLPAEFMLRFQT